LFSSIRLANFLTVAERLRAGTLAHEIWAFSAAATASSISASLAIGMSAMSSPVAGFYIRKQSTSRVKEIATQR
jgi:hypothetical protein